LRPSRQTRVLRGLQRSELIRLLLLVALIPQIAIGVFGGTTFLAHNHDHHELHLHAAGSTAGVEFSTVDHVADHDGAHGSFDGWASDTPDLGDDLSDFHSPNGHHLFEDYSDDHAPAGVKVSVPDLDQWLGRSIELGRNLSSVAVVALVAFSSQPLFYGNQPSVLIDGWSSADRLDICSLRAVDRLVRTSGALLI